MGFEVFSNPGNSMILGFCDHNPSPGQVLWVSPLQCKSNFTWSPQLHFPGEPESWDTLETWATCATQDSGLMGSGLMGSSFRFLSLGQV